MVRGSSCGHWRLFVCVVVTFAGMNPAMAYAQAPSTFAAATAAFQQGDYEQALSLFQQARATGVDTAPLHYNIGVSQYRVGDFADAESTFRSLAERFPQFRALAEYNRGLALLALQRKADAAVAFERARATGDERLAALAASALAELDLDAVAPAPTWLGYLDFALGHDDNVALLDDLSLPTAVSASSVLEELLGYASRRFASRVPLRLDLQGYVVRYPDAEQFDQEAWRVDTAFEWSAGSWRFAAGPNWVYTTLDGDGFESAFGAALRATRALNAQLSFDLRWSYDDISSPTERFDYLTGTRQRLWLGLNRRGPTGRVRVGYELESQDRASPTVSPERERIAVSYARRVQARWSVEGTVALRDSRYGELPVPRHERLLEVVAGAWRELPAGWALNAEYRWTDNDADVAQYSYTSNRISVGVGRNF